ncbi:MAG: orotate phosphoribosyltransferase [archaeon]
MTKKEIAEILLKIKAVTLNVKEPYTYASGIRSPIYTDNRLLMSHVPERRRIVEIMQEALKEKGIDFDVIAGTATAGIPHAAWLSELENSPMIYVRGKQKEHGKQNKVEGNLETGQTVIVVEDLISTGGSSIETVEAIRSAGGIVENVLVIFTYDMKKAKDAFEKAKCNVIALCDFGSMIEEAAERKYITEKEAEIAKEWNKDPENWGKKYGF